MNERETFTMSNHDSYDGYQPGDGQTGRAGGDRGVLEFHIPDNGDEGEAPHV